MDISPNQEKYKGELIYRAILPTVLLMFMIDRALDEITTQFNSALQNPKTGSWEATVINQTFTKIGNYFTNDMRINAFIFYYFDEKVADLHTVGDAPNQIPVSNTYIFAFVVSFDMFRLGIQTFDFNTSNSVPLGGTSSR